MGIRYLTPGLRIVLVSGRDNGGAGYHARVPAPAYSPLAKALGDENSSSQTLRSRFTATVTCPIRWSFFLKLEAD
jgi:hypothetical protein